MCWIAHSEGRTSRARRLTLEARVELERSGYRPGLAETTLLLAHIEHRLSNFFSAMQEAQEALALFEALGMPRGTATSERLLAMISERMSINGSDTNKYGISDKPVKRSAGTAGVPPAVSAKYAQRFARLTARLRAGRPRCQQILDL